MQYNKILVVSNMYPNNKYPSYGVFVKNFCDQLTELNIHYDISALTKTQNKALKIIKYIYFYIRTFFKCLCGGYNLIYIHYPSFSAKPVLVARKLRQFDIISNVHGTDVVPLKSEHVKMLVNTKEAVLKSRFIVTPSEYYKQKILEQYEIDENRIVVYPSGGVNGKIFNEYSQKQKMNLRHNYDIDEDTFIIGYVSRINKAKGWDVFLDALEKTEGCTNRKVKVIIVGSGEDDKELTKRISSLPSVMQDAILRYPLLDQKRLAEIYNMIDVFVFPTTSASESLGLVAIEAMTCGCPVIASDYAAPKYYVINGVNGYKFEVGNSDELSKRLDSFMLLPNEDRVLLRKGATNTGKQYSHEIIIKELRKIFCSS